MTKKSQNKFDAFKPSSLSDWEVAAREELKGADPWEKLKHNVQGCTILPYYGQTGDTQPLPLLNTSGKLFLGARTWYNCPRVIVEDAKRSNREALEHLRNGADGIFFEIDNEKDFQALLKDIDGRYCSLNFLVKKNIDPLSEAISRYLKENNASHDHLPGALFGDKVVSNSPNGNFHFSGYTMPSHSTIADEIATCFKPFAAMADADFLKIADQVAFSITVDTDFFLSAAKLRAVRTVWHRFLISKKINDTPSPFIHAHSLPWTVENFQPHGNILKSTTAAMAAILGGCDALTLEPEDGNSAMLNRVTRNISNILREESFLSKVADPLAGAYFIEKITSQMADDAWKSIILKSGS